MSAITIAYGPTASGKSTAAHAWRKEAQSADLQRVIIDEATFSAAELRRVDNLLDGGTDVWLNYLTDAAEPALPSFPNHDVAIRRFHRRMHDAVRTYGLMQECNGVAIYAPNPYREELWGDVNPEWMCACQRYEAAMDI
ncbi:MULTISPECIES: hypothetical protein [unclassified Microbacterium]|uniref:hypothetical protein n=1 Tax=unclassified Microbacterium TaxID=2609290 RepID=UPI000EA87748|nr:MULTISPECIES: hypothetical protein [unclassified Microbacterium]MBT2484829.1 hypothetical protein [Microbacterium sp. ISL-108]RKN67699.1 hypothetical protein D7252_08930 [Microbacterium sp. CGR2]